MLRILHLHRIQRSIHRAQHITNVLTVEWRVADGKTTEAWAVAKDGDEGLRGEIRCLADGELEEFGEIREVDGRSKG